VISISNCHPENSAAKTLSIASLKGAE